MRIRATIYGTKTRPRLSIFRSNKWMQAQIIDDEKGVTLIGMGDRVKDADKKSKIELARQLGKRLAEAAKKHKIHQLVFDRSGYAYHGRVKALAEGLREGGLEF